MINFYDILVSMRLVNWCERVIEYSFYLLFFLIPLILTPWNYELFEYNKMMAVYALTVIIAGSWLIKMVVSQQRIFRRTPLDIPILFFLLSQILSTVFSIDRHVSLWGYYSRFHGGLLSTISYMLLFYALVSNFPKEKVVNLLKISLLSALVVAFYGTLEHFGIDKNIWVQDVQNRVFSTLGQPNWLAAYLAILIPLTLALALREKLSGFYYFLSALFYICLLFTKSRSGFAGFTAAYLVFWLGVYFLNPKDIKGILRPAALLTAGYLVLSVIIGTPWTPKLQDVISRPKTAGPAAIAPAAPAGPALETGGTESGTIREIVWRGAVDIWKHYPIFGSGVETFAFSYYQFRPKEHNLVSEWDFLYNKAHNEYLNFAATTGSFGLGTYLLLIAAFLFWAGRKLWASRKSGKVAKDSLILLSFAAGFISILITNFFGFSVVPVAIYFYLIPAIAVLLIAQPTTHNQPPLGQTTIPQRGVIITILLTASYLLLILGRMWYADTLFNKAYQLTRAGHYKEAYPLFHQAISLVPQEPLYRDELAYPAAVLAVAAWEQKEPELSNQLADEAISQNKIALAASPMNVNFWKTRTKVFYALSNVNDKYNEEALTSILTAQKLAPTDAKVAYNVGILYGKAGNTQMAVTALEETINLKPNYKDARYALGLYYRETGKKQEAINQMEYILTKIATDDGQAIQKLKEWQ